MDTDAEEKAIKERGFYFHPSPGSTPREAEPRLLPLFPVTSPRVSVIYIIAGIDGADYESKEKNLMITIILNMNTTVSDCPIPYSFSKCKNEWTETQFSSSTTHFRGNVITVRKGKGLMVKDFVSNGQKQLWTSSAVIERVDKWPRNLVEPYQDQNCRKWGRESEGGRDGGTCDDERKETKKGEEGR
ncbi:hypothetical protein SADUNF_Sadunf11G0033200 [Salix dunnii]|uniref:Uncharacterized protein n=1 Tax=Salix dunnii TaxID=1413687 RepID=A0A835JMB4_9ROSI|nr:hypothetical protein SADUNF_Sadunf11G0033200 [Salix dunnii]